jgi:hypothetical protein
MTWAAESCTSVPPLSSDLFAIFLLLPLHWSHTSSLTTRQHHPRHFLSFVFLHLHLSPPATRVIMRRWTAEDNCRVSFKLAMSRLWSILTSPDPPRDSGPTQKFQHKAWHGKHCHVCGTKYAPWLPKWYLANMKDRHHCRGFGLSHFSTQEAGGGRHCGEWWSYPYQHTPEAKGWALHTCQKETEDQP